MVAVIALIAVVFPVVVIVLAVVSQYSHFFFPIFSFTLFSKCNIMRGYRVLFGIYIWPGNANGFDTPVLRNG